MKHTVIAVSLLLVVATSTAALAQGGGRAGRQGAAPAVQTITTLAGDVQSDLDRTRELIINMVDAMPADKFGFKPTPEQRSFAESAMHIVQVDQFLFSALNAKTKAPEINMKATSKADILAALKESGNDWQMAVLKEFNDQQLVARITPPAFLGSTSSRLKVFYYDIGHTQDTYGQLVVYLRLNGVTPPASRRGGV